MKHLTVIGGGLAGTEAAWQAAERGVRVTLVEMRPNTMTAAHHTGDLAELVCSNSLGSDVLHRAQGILKHELRRLHSFVLEVADQHRVPAGSALAVDRTGFAHEITERISSHPRITLVRHEAQSLPDDDIVIIASGPLTSPALAASIQTLTGAQGLFFYDAIAPIVEAASIDMSIAFRASRYRKGDTDAGDYINCPLDEVGYSAFVNALLAAQQIELHAFEREDPHFFEACLPVEVMAGRGIEALAFGPLRPVGLRDPRTDSRPYAVVQLRQDNAAGSLYNMVGFQTNLRHGEQDRVFRLIPGLANARFVRYGSMHRNTYINAPAHLLPTLQHREHSRLLFAGQIAGLEGYVGSVAGGWLAGVNAARLAEGNTPLTLPKDTMTGALIHYITHADQEAFQPMKANFGLLPPAHRQPQSKQARGSQRSHIAYEALLTWLATTSP